MAHAAITTRTLITPLDTWTCDVARCGAEGLVRASLRSGDLFFCGHHWTELEHELMEVALTVLDARQTVS